MNSLSESASSLELQLEQYDSACAKLQTIQAEREAVLADHAATRDDDRLSTLDRAKKTIHLKSMVDILSSDESRQQKVVDEQRQQIAQDSAELVAKFKCRANELIHDKIREHVAVLKQQYNISGFPIEQMVETHESVVQLKRVESGLGNYAMFDASGQLEAARHFRQDVLERLV